MPFYNVYKSLAQLCKITAHHPNSKLGADTKYSVLKECREEEEEDNGDISQTVFNIEATDVLQSVIDEYAAVSPVHIIGDLNEHGQRF